MYARVLNPFLPNIFGIYLLSTASRSYKNSFFINIRFSSIFSIIILHYALIQCNFSVDLIQDIEEKSFFMLLLLYLSSCLSDKAFRFLQESDEGKFPSQFRSPDLNGLILSAIENSNSASHIAFNTDSFSAISDCGASSSATPFLEDYVPGTYKPLKGITISGIALGLSASGIGTIIYKIKDDNGELFDLQIDKVLHLKQLPTRLVSPQQILQQHKSFKNDFTMNHNYA